MSRSFGDGSLDRYLRDKLRREREAREAVEKAKREAEKVDPIDVYFWGPP